jgi:dTDP-6-deoxy-L-talose 4-dehydrogenase (NAD+)
MKTILLTGATGFLGKKILDALNSKDITIYVISRYDESFFVDYQNVTKIIKTKNFFTESADWYKNICNEVDIIIHAAWYAEPGKYLESDLNIECLSGTINFAKAATEEKVQKFVGVGTCFEYDLTSSNPLDIDSQLNPLSLYSRAKASTFKLLEKLFNNHKVDFLWTRVFYLYGEGEDSRRLVAVLRSKLSEGKVVDLTSGNQIRDFMDVELAGSLIADASLSKNVGPFNICSGIGVSIRELAENIADEFGRRDLLNFGALEDNITDAPYVVGVTSKITK